MLKLNQHGLDSFMLPWGFGLHVLVLHSHTTNTKEIAWCSKGWFDLLLLWLCRRHLNTETSNLQCTWNSAVYGPIIPSPFKRNRPGFRGSLCNLLLQCDMSIPLIAFSNIGRSTRRFLESQNEYVLVRPSCVAL